LFKVFYGGLVQTLAS